MKPAGDATRRPIRSFVRRAGRMTPSQARALEDLWPRYGIDGGSAPLEPAGLFARTAPLTVEIGFGNGETLHALAAAHPERDYLGIEVHEPGVGHLLRLLGDSGLGNVRIVRQDAVEVLAGRLPPACVDEVLLLFPDPWPKKRHHKRRLVQPDFLASLAAVMREGGWLRLATDWADYAQQMADVCRRSPWFDESAAEAERSRPLVTRFERRGLALGHAVTELSFRRNARRPAAA
jgi:tRNA (guanine-N7-)-methyltransferase